LTGAAIAAGVTVGLGVVLLAAGLLPPGPPDLRAALARLDTEPARGANPGWNGGEPVAVRRVRWWERAGGWVAARTPAAGLFAAPAADLRLLGVTPVSFAAGRAAAAAGGLAFPVVVWTVTGLAGIPLPAALPGVVGVGLAAAGWLAPAAVLRQRASGERAALRVALSAYLDLVALERAGAGSPVEALEAAAAVGHGPAFTLIRSRLLLAARAGTSPYAALADLSSEIGVAELRDLADIAAVAADGAAVYATLLAKSRSLRNAIGADAQAAANAASERLVFPVVLLGAGFLLLVFYPALARLLAAG
jgi:pilus assembly protein TadC